MYTRTAIVLMTAIGLLVLCAPAAAQTEENKAVGLRGINEVWSQGNLAVVDEIIADDYVYHEVAMGEVVGAEGLKQAVSTYRAAYPDLGFVVDDIIAEDDLVLMRWTASGTHQGDLMGIPATGLETTSVGMNITRYRDGKAVEEWTYWDVMGLMQQLGVSAPPRPGPEDYLWGAPSSATGDPGNPEANKALVQRLFDEAITGSFDIIDELMADDYIFHDPVSPVEVRGPEGYKQEFGMYLTAFPDIQITFEQMIAEGDKVAIRWTLSGTHEGELMGIPPTGRRVAVQGISMFRVADGKFVETWASYDAMGMIQQLTAEEWPIDGPWITTVPTPMGNMIIKGTWIAQDAAQTRFTGEFDQITVYPLFADLFPDFEAVKFAGALAVKTGLNQYEMTAIEYFTTATGPSQEEIVGIGIVAGSVELVGPDLAQGQGTGAYYVAAQDADQDGFPDEGQEPVVCVPWTWTAKRLPIIPPCVPAPPAE